MTSPALPGDRRTLRNFYALRAVVAFAWVIAALASAHLPLAAAAVLLTIYPAWDALANLLDARRHGGWRAQPGQRVNAAISLATAIGMAVALAVQGNRGGVLVFGVWALLAGLLQLIVAIRRRALGGQAFMMISGVQSALAGIVFCVQAFGAAPGIAQLAPYAAFGGFYFLLSALWLGFRKTPPAPARA